MDGGNLAPPNVAIPKIPCTSLGVSILRFTRFGVNICGVAKWCKICSLQRVDEEPTPPNWPDRS